MTKINQAAYVPFDDHTDWDDAVALAVDWVEQRCAEEGSAALLVTHTVDGARYTPKLESFVERHRNHATPRSRTARRNSGPGPVLAYVPDADLLHFAIGLARNSSLCVVEGSFSVAGWAAATSALDLVTGQETAPVAEDIQDELERLRFYGNNGWGDQWGKQWAIRILPTVLRELPSDGRTADVIAGWMLAKGASDNGVRNLAKVIDRL